MQASVEIGTTLRPSTVQKMWARLTGRKPERGTLEDQLDLITGTAILDIPEELIRPILQASFNEKDRPVIMKHVHQCLTETSGKHWKRVHAGLVLTEKLLRSGSLDLLVEIGGGRYFDLVQRLTFLEDSAERYEDKNAKKIVKERAEKLRKEAMPRLQQALEEAGTVSSENEPYSVCRPSASTTAPGIAYRKSKDFNDKVHGDRIAFYGSSVQGVDEGDGWVRIGNFYLPMQLPTGERVLEPSRKAVMEQFGEMMAMMKTNSEDSADAEEAEKLTDSTEKKGATSTPALDLPKKPKNMAASAHRPSDGDLISFDKETKMGRTSTAGSSKSSRSRRSSLGELGEAALQCCAKPCK